LCGVKLTKNTIALTSDPFSDTGFCREAVPCWSKHGLNAVKIRDRPIRHEYDTIWYERLTWGQPNLHVALVTKKRNTNIKKKLKQTNASGH